MFTFGKPEVTSHQKYVHFFSFDFVQKKPSLARKPSQAKEQAKPKNQVKPKTKPSQKQSQAKKPSQAQNQAKPPTFLWFPSQANPSHKNLLAC